MSTKPNGNDPIEPGDGTGGAERPAGRTRRTRRWLAVGGAAAAAVLALAVPAVAGGDVDAGETDQPITGEALDKASAAALDHLGEGRVTDTEVDDEDSYYEVEVTLDDGRQIDVQLDEDFNVVGSEADTEDDS